MPSQTTQAIVLRVANYRDHDRMLTLLTPQSGRVDALSRGCRRPRSPLLTGSELFARGEYVLFRSRDKYTLTSCMPEDTYYPLRMELKRLTCASYMAGLCFLSAQPDEPAAELYALLLRGLYRLAYVTEEPPLNVTTAFLLLYAVILGYRPRMNHCARCRAPIDHERGCALDIAAGGLCCKKCATQASYPLTAPQVKWMMAVMKDGFVSMGSDSDKHLFECMRRYVEQRIDASVRAGSMLP